VVSIGAIDPTVMMGALEELLTGRPFLEQILKDPGRKPVAIGDEGERLVIPLGSRVDQALAAASDDRLREVAIPWSRTDEFRGRGDPMVLAKGLIRLAALARRAAQSGHRVYCWFSV
jgi:hypothetical protein